MLYSCIQLVTLVLWCHVSPQRTPILIVAATLSFMVTIFMGALSYIEHSRSLQPSDLLDLYLFFSVVLDATQARALWLLLSASPLPQVVTVAIVMKVGVLLLESLEKTASVTFNHANRSPEETSSIFNRAFFYWLNNLIVTGYWKVLSQEDLFPLREELTAISLYKKIRIAWQSGRNDIL